jgi:cobalt-zinc-cadmium efflux system membrane fusion protein
MNRARLRRACALLCAAAPLLAGCGDNARHEEAEEHDHDAHEDAQRHGSASADTLRVDPSMLRDLRITTQPAESRPAGDTVTLLGELRVNEDAYAEVGASIEARVSRVLAAPGDTVTAGQPLVELDSLEVGRARASIATSRARLQLAQQSVVRRRELAADKIVPQREMQSSEAELAQADAESRAAEQSLSALGAVRGSGARFTLASPIAGTVIDRSALRGRMVDAEQPLFVVSDLARLWLIVHAFERDALRVRTGSSARVTFPALPGQTFGGEITRVGSRVDPVSRTIDVRIEIDNPTRLLRPGMSASAIVPLGAAEERVVAVAVEAVQRQAAGWCVFLPRALPGGEEGVFEIRKVGRGRDLGGEVEILSGLRAGERVVVDGAFLLKAEADKLRGGGEAEHHH